MVKALVYQMPLIQLVINLLVTILETADVLERTVSERCASSSSILMNSTVVGGKQRIFDSRSHKHQLLYDRDVGLQHLDGSVQSNQHVELLQSNGTLLTQLAEK